MAESLKAICDDYGLTPEGVRYALKQYQRVVVELTNSRFSKLTYPADLIINTAIDCFQEDARREAEEAHAARIMTFDEVIRSTVDPVYLQDNDGEEYWLMYFGFLKDIYLGRDKDGRIRDFRKETYGKTWRCWTKRPNDKQWEMKWDDQG